MEKMDLSYNQLTSLGRGVFKGLSRLRQLYLNNNRLIVLQQGSLDMLPTLEVCMETSVCWTRCMCLTLTVRCVQVLQLSNNNISQIDGESLAPLYSLAMLALDGNQLQHLKFKTFINLHTTATHIQLSGLQPLLFRFVCNVTSQSFLIGTSGSGQSTTSELPRSWSKPILSFKRVRPPLGFHSTLLNCHMATVCLSSHEVETKCIL